MRRGEWIRTIACFVVVLAVVLCAVFANKLAPYNPDADTANRFAGSSLQHLLGTDQFGRDIFSRIIFGARASLEVAFGSASIAALLGVGLGLVAGYYGGFAEGLVMRVMDVILCFPPIILALLVVTLLGPGVVTLIFVIGFLFIPTFARITNAQVAVVKRTEYVQAAKALGSGPARVMMRSILPNVASPLIVQYTLTLAAAILLESGLSFLGLGVVPPTPSWGAMIAEAMGVMAQSPANLLWPCLVITVTIMAMNGAGDTLRDALDPRVRSTLRRSRREATLDALDSAPAARAQDDKGLQAGVS